MENRKYWSHQEKNVNHYKQINKNVTIIRQTAKYRCQDSNESENGHHDRTVDIRMKMLSWVRDLGSKHH